MGHTLQFSFFKHNFFFLKHHKLTKIKKIKGDQSNAYLFLDLLLGRGSPVSRASSSPIISEATWASSPTSALFRSTSSTLFTLTSVSSFSSIDCVNRTQPPLTHLSTMTTHVLLYTCVFQFYFLPSNFIPFNVIIYLDILCLLLEKCVFTEHLHMHYTV